MKILANSVLKNSIKIEIILDAYDNKLSADILLPPRIDIKNLSTDQLSEWNKFIDDIDDLLQTYQYKGILTISKDKSISNKSEISTYWEFYFNKYGIAEPNETYLIDFCITNHTNNSRKFISDKDLRSIRILVNNTLFETYESAKEFIRQTILDWFASYELRFKNMDFGKKNVIGINLESIKSAINSKIQDKILLQDAKSIGYPAYFNALSNLADAIMLDIKEHHIPGNKYSRQYVMDLIDKYYLDDIAYIEEILENIDDLGD